MPSPALKAWQGTRAVRLDNLVSAHSKITGGTPGRKWVTEELNHALIVRLASEFQGFCRDLHDDSINSIIHAKFATDIVMATIVRGSFEDERRLDRGNATWSNVVKDFNRLGIRLGVGLKDRYPKRAPRWIAKIDSLNDARNAIVHSNTRELARITAEQPLTLQAFRMWRGSLNETVTGLDKITASYLAKLAIPTLY